jgi:hypothetical protein
VIRAAVHQTGIVFSQVLVVLHGSQLWRKSKPIHCNHRLARRFHQNRAFSAQSEAAEFYHSCGKHGGDTRVHRIAPFLKNAHTGFRHQRMSGSDYAALAHDQRF